VSSNLFFAAAVGAGFVLIGLVVYSYVRPRPEHRPSVTALLGLLGFALVASPNWTSISIKGEGLELSLIREMQARQLEALEELREATAGSALAPTAAPRPAPATSRPGIRPPSPEPVRPAIDPPPEAAQPDPSPSLATALSEDQKQELFAAFERGELELRKLTTTELLALNERVTERTSHPTRSGLLPDFR
jgi:hypothetical protein